MGRFNGPDPSPQEERAARELCRLRRLNPDEIVQHGPLDGSGCAVSVRSPRFRLAAHEIRAHLQIHLAVALTEDDDEETPIPAGMDEYGGLE